MAMAAAVLLALADLDEAVDVWDAMRAHAYRNGSAFTIGSVQLWGGYTQYLRGDLGEAESELRASLETVAFWGMPTQASGNRQSSPRSSSSAASSARPAPCSTR